jgi:DNA-binding response OmpR family regulator
MTMQHGDTHAAAKTILVVEDEESLASTLSYNLRKNGFNVVSAADGVAGLQAARRDRPDVIVLDLMLPKMDGLEVCRRIGLVGSEMCIRDSRQERGTRQSSRP